MDLRMMLSHEGANYLRDWAEAMPVAIQNIIESTEKVTSVYQSVSDSVGPHRAAFYQMLLNIKKMQEESVKNARFCLTFFSNPDKLYLIILSLFFFGPVPGRRMLPQASARGSMSFILFI